MTAVAAVILAAGRGTRFQAASGHTESKLLSVHEGRALVRHVAEAAAVSRASPIAVVTGHQAAEIRGTLAGLPLEFVHNPGFAAGLSTSLKAGIAALPLRCVGALVLLADMPGVTFGTLDALIGRAAAHPEADAVVPTQDGRRGNPVLLMRSLFSAVAQLDGDEGARQLLARPGLHLEKVEDPSSAVLADVDHPDDLLRLETHGPDYLGRAAGANEIRTTSFMEDRDK